MAHHLQMWPLVVILIKDANMQFGVYSFFTVLSNKYAKKYIILLMYAKVTTNLS